MPNWCYNKVTIDGFRSHLKTFVDQAAANNEEEDLSLLRAFIPMPEEFTTIEGYNNGGYEWAHSNWGTKWAESSIDMTGSIFGQTGQIVYQFDSPWCPPEKGYQKISEMFPYLTFTHYWDEPGMCFCGISVTIAGEQIMIEEVDENYPALTLDTSEGEQEFFDSVMSIRDQLFLSANNAIKNLT